MGLWKYLLIPRTLEAYRSKVSRSNNFAIVNRLEPIFAWGISIYPKGRTVTSRRDSSRLPWLLGRAHAWARTPRFIAIRIACSPEAIGKAEDHRTRNCLDHPAKVTQLVRQL